MCHLEITIWQDWIESNKVSKNQLKRFRLQKCSETFLNFSYLDVEGVIKYLDYYIGKDKNSFLLVMERPILYKDLFEIISDQDYLEENAACYYFKQLVYVVIGCHKHGVIHR